jgi:hypothetical protein
VSAVARLPAEGVREQTPATRWLRAWTRLTWRHALGVALATSMTGVIDLSVLVDKFGQPGVPVIIGFDLFASVLLFTITLLAWSAAVADRAPGDPARTRALVVAVLVSGLLAACIVVPVHGALGLPEIWWELMGKKRPVPPAWLAILGNASHLGVMSFLFVLAAEVVQRRAVTSAAILASQREQAEMARQVLESRLAAMQAQVEPQFLFNSLVGIEALYQKDAGTAAANLDRLIQYLRVALPRLREPGSSVGAEIDLVRAYLAVVTALHGGRPTLTVTVSDECSGVRFYPMLLLPLIQRAVRDVGELPDSIRIGASKVGDEIAIVTRIATRGGCNEDFELARVRERLQGLYGNRASLQCDELDPRTTQFTLRVPTETTRPT